MKKFTLVFAFSLFAVLQLSARIVPLEAGAMVSDALKDYLDGDTILLTQSGTYLWKASVTVTTAKSLTIVGAEGLTTRPVIQFSAASVSFSYLTYKTDAVSLHFKNVDFDGNKKTNYFLVVKSNTPGFNVSIDNCIVRNLAGTASTSWAISYSNSATVPSPGFLSIKNSIFKDCGEGVLVSNGAGRPDSISLSNCYFGGNMVKGTLRSISAKLGGAIRKVVIDHCTFDGNSNADLTINNDTLNGSNTVISNSLFSKPTASAANLLGNGGNFKNHSAVFVGDMVFTQFADSLLDNTTLLIDPLIDPATLVATAPLFVAAGSDGETIGYHANFFTGIANPRLNVSTVKVHRTVDGIYLTFNGKSKIEIFDAMGRLVDAKVADQNYRKALPRGLYIIMVNNQMIKFLN